MSSFARLSEASLAFRRLLHGDRSCCPQAASGLVTINFGCHNFLVRIREPDLLPLWVVMVAMGELLQVKFLFPN